VTYRNCHSSAHHFIDRTNEGQHKSVPAIHHRLPHTNLGKCSRLYYVFIAAFLRYSTVFRNDDGIIIHASNDPVYGNKNLLKHMHCGLANYHIRI